jgi:hypothetical protein
MNSRTLGVVAVATLALFFSPPLSDTAEACGGFFCNAATQSPIYQGGERILFGRHGDKVTMHVEVIYSGDPTTFGWILPIPDVPKDADGNDVPLDETLQISSSDIFQTLQDRTNPIFNISNTMDPGFWDCQDALFDNGAVSDSAASGGGGGGEAPPVVVLQEAKVGPYDAQMIEASDSDSLFVWLNDNGYFQDPAAKPLIEHYLGAGWKFVGIRLQSGKTTGDLKPLSLTLDETAPCVPLRLTSIAATPNMPILVWVMGEGRAIPKNFIHVVVNDRAIEFPGGANYIEVVSAAVDTVDGRAWVTEHAGPSSDMAGRFISANARDVSWMDAVATLGDVLDGVSAHGVPRNADYQDILMAEVTHPEGLTGYPNGNCYYDPSCSAENPYGCGGGGWYYDYYYYGPGWSDGGGSDGSGGESWPHWVPANCFDNDGHTTTESEFYGYLDYWAEQAAAGELEITANLGELMARIQAEIIDPLGRAEDLVAQTTTLTRFFTTQDPEEMTRDPLFAFNPDLPDVDRRRTLTTVITVDDDCEPYVDATYPDGKKATFPCEGGCWGISTVGPVPGAPALLRAEVIDEWGVPLPFDPAQAGEVDTLLGYAEPGTPSLPEDFDLHEAPPIDDGSIGPVADLNGGSGASSDDDSWCSAGDPAGGLSILIALFTLLMLSRRRRWTARKVGI